MLNKLRPCQAGSQTLFSRWRLKRKRDWSSRRRLRARKIRVDLSMKTHKWSSQCLRSQRISLPNSRIPKLLTRLGKRLSQTLLWLTWVLRKSKNSSTMNTLKNLWRLRETSTEVEKGNLLLTVPEVLRISLQISSNWIHSLKSRDPPQIFLTLSWWKSSTATSKRCATAGNFRRESPTA